jgi:type IV pilus assembly protein PilX
MRLHKSVVSPFPRAIVVRAKQQGVALFAALIALVILLLATATLIRSTDIAQAISGNLSIKRDITHQSELAVQNALALFASGGALSAETTREASLAAANYSAVVLASNAYGVPVSLVEASTSGETSAGAGLTWRYVIDRMCPVAGAYNASTNACLLMQNYGRFNQSMDAHNKMPSASGSGNKLVYRISVRVTDARGAQSYFQTTYAVPQI